MQKHRHFRNRQGKRLLLGLLCCFSLQCASAQFYTIGQPRVISTLQKRKVVETPPPEEPVDSISSDTADVEEPFTPPDTLIACSPPLDGRLKISSRYGYRRNPFSKKRREFHSGLDLSAKKGTRVLAMLPGIIVGVGYDSRAGNYVKVRHGSFTVSYCHLMRKPSLPIGLQLEAGDPIAHVGSTGRSTGPHLHITLKRNGRTINPEDFLKFFGILKRS